MRRRKLLWAAAIAIAIAGGRGLIGDSRYQAEIAEWRKNYDRDLRSEKGPLWLIARHTVAEGRTEIGSDTSNSIKLPDRAPKRIGAFERRSDKVTFVPAAGIAVNLNGKPMTGPAVLRTGVAPDPRDRIQFGDFEVIVTALDGNCQLAVRDRQSPLLKTFRGALWFPVNAGYRVEAAFTPYPQPKELKIPDTSGRIRTRQVPGYVTFQLNGDTMRLEPIATGNELFFMFKDRTSGRETYGAGRYLDTEMPKNGKVVLDFNKAYNPYCALNPNSSCPIPPKQNTLLTRVEAGEKHRGEH
jgi:uncharacterized protein (DUF1684 family)